MTLTLLAVAWLLTYLLHSTILLGGAWLLSATGVVRSPVAKDTLWKVCLVGGILTASVQSFFPYQPYSRHYLLPSAAQSAPPVVPRAPRLDGAARAASAVTSERSRSVVAPAPRRVVAPGGLPGSLASATTHHLPPITWPVVLLGVWALGAAFLLARGLLCRFRLSRHFGERREIVDGPVVETLESLRRSAGVRRRIRLTASADLAAPVAMGASEICLPERALTSLSEAEQRAVLAHELGHLVRQDPSWLALSVASESLLFLQPLNRLARRRIQEAAEYLCDDWAVHQTGGSLTLAKCLAEVATWIEASPRSVPVSGMAENRSQLIERVHRLLEGAQPKATRGIRMAVPVAALALSSLAFAAPGVSPPCDQDVPAAAPHARLVQPAAATLVQGGSRTWAVISDGRLLSFRSGFGPRITGQGHLGIRRGGRAIELADGQQLLVNGRPADADAEVRVCETDTLRIADRDGHVLWQIEPVRLSVEQARLDGRADFEQQAELAAERLYTASARVEALREAADSLSDSVEDVDTADVAELARTAQELGEEVARSVRVSVVPHVAELVRLSTRISTALTPAVVRATSGKTLRRRL
jgi:beta-lactamase regulating signal transducer with metallopeptidase domain